MEIKLVFERKWLKMKISKLIKELQEIMDENGDMEVYVHSDDGINIAGDLGIYTYLNNKGKHVIINGE